MANFNLRQKHGEWYCVCSFRDQNNARKERWIPLKLAVKDNTKREAQNLVLALSEPGAFDPGDLLLSNETMKRLGLYPFDDSWHVMRSGPKVVVKPQMGRPKVYAPIETLGTREINAGQTELKRGKRMLFGDYLAIWYGINKNKWAVTTQASLERQIYHRLIPYFNEEKITLTGLKPEDIESFYRTLMEEGNSGNTVCHYHETIRSALQYAFKKGYIDINVADRVDKPGKGDFRGSFYNEEELQKLFEATKNTNLDFPVHMAAFYGLRREEICGLKWDSIDFQYKAITIKSTITEATVKGKYQLILRDSTKNSSSFRTLPMTDRTMQILLDMKARREKMEKIFGNRYNHDFDEYVCCFENGDIIRPGWITANFPKLLEDNHLRKIRFHDLRHSCATLLRHEGIPMEEISKWLGHSSTQTTERVYAHYDEEGKKTTLDALKKALEKDDPEMK
ncbi:MAG: site-specific integrase [bacterium]|nr:site-specific integrase [bacterium]